MRPIFVFFLCLASLLPACANRDPSSNFNSLFSEKYYKKALEVALQWEKSEPDDPEAFVAASNAYYELAVQEAPVATLPPGNGDTSLVDPTTGKAAPNVAPPVPYEPGLMKAAVENLEKAAAKFPYRLDLWFGVAYLYQHMDDFSGEYSALTNAMKYSTAFPEKLKWFKNQPLPKAPEILVPETMQDFCAYIQNRLKPNWDGYGELSQLTAEYYPNHPFAFDNLGNYYLLRKEYDKSERNYLRANELAPNDSLILNNLANLYVVKKEYAKARATYQKTIDLNNDPAAVAEAEQKMKRKGR